MENERIWVESLLTLEEWKECSRIYSTYNTNAPPEYSPEKYKRTWRKNMGRGYNEEERKIVNNNFKELIKNLKQ